MDHTTIILPTTYQPHLDDQYMSTEMCDYFRVKLCDWQQELQALIEIDRQALEDREPRPADELEDAIVAQAWLERAHQLQRHRQLYKQIDAALARITQGTYGYCEQTGEEIGVKRLEAWPIATLSLNHQVYQEHRAKMAQARQSLAHWSVTR